MEDDEFTFDWIEDAHDWSPERMAAYPLVILTKSNNISAADQTGWMTDAVQAAFADHVRRGNGLLAIHSGTAGYAEMPVLRGVLGGVFTHHPKQCPVTVEPQAGHPLCAGSDPFTLQDEHYFVALDDPQAEVYMTTRSEHGEQPGRLAADRGRRTRGGIDARPQCGGLAASLFPGVAAQHLALVWHGRLTREGRAEIADGTHCFCHRG